MNIFALNTYSQSGKVSLNFKNAKVEDVLNQIEKSSEYYFAYNQKLINVNRRIDIIAKNESIKDVLHDIFKNTQTDYVVINRQIVLSPSQYTNEDLVDIQQQQKGIAITGLVKDAASGETLPGVSVLVKGTDKGAITDAQGKFSLIIVNSKATLIFSSMGYNSQDVNLSGKTNLSILLVPNVKNLDEVVVVGYGTQKKRDVIGSVTTIQGKSFQSIQSPNFDAAMQGQISGVSIQSSTGVAGAPTKVMIRGINSINSGKDPLWIIDGMPVFSYQGGLAGGNVGTTSQSPMSLINSNDIESVQVLKDAAATAIYGSRGSNGVIIITTKSGRTLKGITSFDFTTGISDLTRTPGDVGYVNTKEWFQIMDKAYKNGGRGQFDINDYYQLVPKAFNKITRAQAENINTDWYNQIFHKANFKDFNLSSSKKFEDGSYFISVNYRNDDGVQKNSGLSRYSARINIDFKPLKDLIVGAKLNFSMTENNRQENYGVRGGNVGNSSGTAGGLNTITNYSLPWLPVYDPTNPKDYFNPYAEFNVTAYNSPNNYKNTVETYRALGGLFAEYNLPIKGLSLRSEFSFDGIQSNNTMWLSGNIRLNSNNVPSTQATEQTVTWNSINYNAYLTYNRTIGKHSLLFVGGSEAQRTSSYTRSAQGEGLTGSFQQLGNPTSMLSMYGGMGSENYLLAYFARANYKFKDKYLLGISFRRDGSSTFTSKHRWGNFAAVSAGWILSDEDFMSFMNKKNVFLKLRGSLGQTGNQSVPSGLDAINYYHQSLINYGSVATGGVNGTLPGNIAVQDLTWEKTNSLDIGLDYGFFSNKITGSIAYYDKYVQGMLLQGPIAASSGLDGGQYSSTPAYSLTASSVWANIGNMRSKGVEFEIKSVNFDKGKFKWTTQFNIAFNKSLIKKLTTDADLSGKGVIVDGNLYRTGHIRNEYYTAEYAKVDPQTGIEMIYVLDKNTYNKTGNTIRLKNVSGSDSLTWASQTAMNNNKFELGKSSDPTYYGGLSNTFGYKGFDLTILFTFSGGNWIYDYDEQVSSYPSAERNMRKTLLQSWEKPGDISNYPQLQYRNIYVINGVPVNDFQKERSSYSKFMYKGDFIRLKNIQFGYNVPSSIINKLKIQGIRVYVSGTNLWTKTKYPGYDPEGSGYVYTALIPQLKTYSFGVNIKF
jgi:TonB-linked SusC/RagA family outer membrane protein